MDDGVNNGGGLKGRFVFAALAVFAAAVLSFAAVWMGGLNQDEGWYLYAANLVAEGKMLYRDFFYTQGPLMPIVYSAFTAVWKGFGILGARVFTLSLGFAGVVLACALAARLAPRGRKAAAALTVALLLGSNLYHLYYIAIPKTYALASLFVVVGFFFLSFLPARAGGGSWARALAFGTGAGLSLALAAGTRISLGILLCTAGTWLLVSRRWRELAAFCVGGFGGLALVYGPFLLDADAFAGLVAAQRYHAARGGFDPVWTVGSVSRLVRWYLPVFVVLGMGVAFAASGRACGGENDESAAPRAIAPLLLVSFAAVFLVQMLAPFPYEDYQVPVMGIVAAFAAAKFARGGAGTQTLRMVLVLGLAWASTFGSPLLERWTTNGQDRFWSLKKSAFELKQLRDVARRIEALDPGGREIFTQDLYLAVETGRKVPAGLEMGPFSMLSDERWRELLSSAPCEIAAFSGYAFAIDPPKCDERPVERQIEYWEALKRNYELVDREEAFGQNATTLLVLRRKASAGKGTPQ